MKELRKKRGLSLRELGEQINVNFSHISRLESGKKIPSLEMIQLLADFYNVPPSYFFENEDVDSRDLTDTEEEFMDDLELPIEEIRKKYNLTFEGKQLSDEELRGIMTWLKINRSI